MDHVQHWRDLLSLNLVAFILSPTLLSCGRGAYVEVKGQFERVNSLSCGSQGSNSDHKAWWQVATSFETGSLVAPAGFEQLTIAKDDLELLLGLWVSPAPPLPLLSQVSSVWLWLVWNLPCEQGWPERHRNSPAWASRVLGLRCF